MECGPGTNLTREADGNVSYAYRLSRRISLPALTGAGGRASRRDMLRSSHYPYSTRGRIVTMPGQSVSSSTKPIMIIRYGIVTRAI